MKQRNSESHHHEASKKKDSRQELFEELKKAITSRRNADEIRKIIQKFKDNNYFYNSSYFDFDENALHLAARNGCANVVEYLLTEDFDIKTKNVNGNSAYHLAAFYNNLNVLKVLLEKRPLGDATTVLSNYNQTILHSSLSKPTAGLNCFKFIIEQYKNDKNFINAQDNYGKTVLHIAVEKKNIEAVRFLLENGADKNISCNAGETPADIAKKNNQSEILELLEAKAYSMPIASNPLSQFSTNSMPIQTHQTLRTDQSFQALNSFSALNSMPQLSLLTTPMLSQNNLTNTMPFLQMPSSLFTTQHPSPTVTPTKSKKENNGKEDKNAKKKRYNDLKILQNYCIDESKKHVSELQINIDKKFAQLIPALNQKLEEVGQRLTEKQNDTTLQQDVTNLQTEIGKAKNSFNQLSTEIKNQKQKSNQFEEKLGGFAKQHNSQSKTIAELQETLTVISKRNDELEKDRKEMSHTIDTLKKMVELQSKRIDNLEKNQSLQSDMSNLAKPGSSTPPTLVKHSEADKQTVKRVAETFSNAINPEGHAQNKKQKVEEKAPTTPTQKPSELSLLKSVLKKK